MKNNAKKVLAKRGIVVAGRAQNAPSTSVHDDKRRTKRSGDKQRLKRELQFETARTRGPFPFVTRVFVGYFSS